MSIALPMKKLSMEEYIHALEKMKRSPRDRLGILGELGVTGLASRLESLCPEL